MLISWQCNFRRGWVLHQPVRRQRQPVWGDTDRVQVWGAQEHKGAPAQGIVFDHHRCILLTPSSMSGAEKGPAEADQARQGLRWGKEIFFFIFIIFFFFLGEEAEAPKECECQAGPGAGGDHSAGRCQGGPAAKYGPAVCQVKCPDFVNMWGAKYCQVLWVLL